VLSALLIASGAGLAGCLGSGGGNNVKLVQTGSSTVLPLAEAWAQKFSAQNSNVRIDVSGGGSSHGRNQLLTGKAHLGDASSKIGPGDYDAVGCSVSESDIQAAQNGPHPWEYPSCDGVTPTEWVVAWDVLTVVVHPDNDWVTELNYSQLRQIFTTEDTAETWDEVDGLEGAPNEEIRIHAPDAASGTYEFFFEEVAGHTDKSLLNAGSDRYQGSANDDIILSKIANDKHAVGFFGLAYFNQNKGKVSAVSIAEEGDDHVEPSFETASEYPITRPLHVYTDGIPSGDTQENQALKDYMRYMYSSDGQGVVPTVGYVAEDDFEPDVFSNQQSKLN
jgi:phosphate transport system substrate-binding protein